MRATTKRLKEWIIRLVTRRISAQKWIGRLGLPIAIMLALVFFIADRQGTLTDYLRHAGPLGAFAAIALVALLCMTPFPSEGFVLMCLKVYGIWWGLGYALIGCLLGTAITYVLSRQLSPFWVRRLSTSTNLQYMENWLSGAGTWRILLLRLLPLPGIVVNYALGMFSPVSFVTYMWTAGVSILPYYLATAFVFEGVSKGSWLPYLLALGMLMAMAVSGRIVRRFYHHPLSGPDSLSPTAPRLRRP